MSKIVAKDLMKDADLSAVEAVQVALELLKEVTISGYIPFSSPAPSSTEVRIRDMIRGGIQRLEFTLDLMGELHAIQRQLPERKPGQCELCRFFVGNDSSCSITGCYTYGKSLRKCFDSKDVEEVGDE